MSPLAGGLGLALGLIGGSFVGALVTRWPEGGSVVRGRSRCDGCARTLGPADLIPVLSYVVLRARCGACGHPIATDHLAAEIGGAVVGLTSALLAPDLPTALLSGTFGALLLALGLLDARHFWLPDRLTLPLLGLGLLAPLAARIGPGLGEAAGTALVAFFLFEGLRLGFRRLRGREGLGGGDSKLVAGLGAWLGPVPLTHVILAASLLGLLWAALRGRAQRNAPLPLGSLLAVAAWPVWLANLD